MDLDDDLVLAMPHRFNDLELIVGSRGSAHWISTGNGQIRSLRTLDTHVGGAFVETAEGPSLSKYWTKESHVHMRSNEVDGLFVAGLEAERLVVEGPARLDVCGNSTVDVLRVASRRVTLDATLRAGQIGPGTRITCNSDAALVVIGDTMGFAEHAI